MGTHFPSFSKTNNSDMPVPTKSPLDKTTTNALPNKITVSRQDAFKFISGQLPLSDLSTRNFAQLHSPELGHDITSIIPSAFFEDSQKRGVELPDIKSFLGNREKFNDFIKQFFTENLQSMESTSSPVLKFYEATAKNPENIQFLPLGLGKRLLTEDNSEKSKLEETMEVPIEEESKDTKLLESETIERNVNWIRLIFDAPNFFKNHAIVNEESKEYFNSEENAEELKNDPAFEGYQGYTLTNEDLQNISQDFKKVFLPLFFDALNDYVASQKTTKPEEEKPSLSEVAEDLEASRNTVAKKEESKDKTAHKKTKADSTLTASLKNKEIAENKAAEANRQKIKKENIEKTLEKLQHIHITDRLHELNEQQTIETATLTADRIKKGAAPAA